MKLPCAGEGRAIPRVDTFASNLHDSWGAHALHNSPPATEGGALQDPPRLSTESARSATSQASKASSGESISFLALCFRKGPCALTWTQSSNGYAIQSTPSALQGVTSPPGPPPPSLRPPQELNPPPSINPLVPPVTVLTPLSSRPLPLSTWTACTSCTSTERSALFFPSGISGSNQSVRAFAPGS